MSTTSSNVGSRNTSGSSGARAPTTEELMGMIGQLQGHIQTLEGRLAVKSIKVRPPETFDGTRSKLRAFTTQLDLYLRMNHKKLAHEADKVFFASTYLTGPAFDWFEPYIRDYQEQPVDKQDDDTKEIFASYDDFKRRLQGTFGDIDATRNAERKLWRLRQTGSVSKLASDFQQIISHLDWDEDSYIAKFEEILKPEIQEKLIWMEKPNSLSKMIEQAVKIDNKLYDFNARRKENRSGIRFQGHQKTNSYRANDRQTAQPRSQGYSDPYRLQPMELDATERRSQDKSDYPRIPDDVEGATRRLANSLQIFSEATETLLNATRYDENWEERQFQDPEISDSEDSEHWPIDDETDESPKTIRQDAHAGNQGALALDTPCTQITGEDIGQDVGKTIVKFTMTRSLDNISYDSYKVLNQNARVMVDSGTTGNFMDPRFQEQLKILGITKATPEPITGLNASFQRFINEVLGELLDTFVIAYLDDILVFSNNEEEHIRHVKQVLRKLRIAKLRLKLKKCEFYIQETEFLGHWITTEGVHMERSKVQAIRDWPVPKSLKEVQQFTGLINYYRKFIDGYTKSMAQQVFDDVKRKITTVPILVQYDPEKLTTIETDVSNYAIGMRMTQLDKNGRAKPIAFHSRKLIQAEMNYDIHDKELLAIVTAFKVWRVYLEGAQHQILVKTDYKNLTFFTTTKELTRRQARWSEKLSQFNFRIEHCKGTENGQADALSR
ncbi:uncharacterized protein KD926_003523 [Aspergillus affinis]|uniref:uncharacterized protein n=1 Tax=Aspergillus affinis TaxID=1070780 RepID=UPI0022FE07EC|nr:uncharacterized protein KD926_003523 [Aspergillus affinis]KAI9035401.1 hypothetical protein KD926_003523 [Aspergillus affinis]